MRAEETFCRPLASNLIASIMPTYLNNIGQSMFGEECDETAAWSECYRQKRRIMDVVDSDEHELEAKRQNVRRVSSLRASTLAQRAHVSRGITKRECKLISDREAEVEREKKAERKRIAALRREEKRLKIAKRENAKLTDEVGRKRRDLMEMLKLLKLVAESDPHAKPKPSAPCTPEVTRSGLAYLFDVMECHALDMANHRVEHTSTIADFMSMHGEPIEDDRMIYVPPQFDNPCNQCVFDPHKPNVLLPTLTGGFSLAPNRSALRMRRHRDAVRPDAPGVFELSVSEGTVLSGFPADYTWIGQKSRDKTKQIANAVPPPMGELVVRGMMCVYHGVDLEEMTAVDGPGIFGASEGLLIGSQWLVVDLFCGAGGFSLGVNNAFGETASDLVTLAFDSWDPAVQTYRENHGPKSFCVHGDVSNVGQIMNYIDKFKRKFPDRRVLLVAGPPCQDFSTVGARKHGKRASMLAATAIIARLCKADAVIVENVKALTSHHDSPVFTSFLDIMTKRGTATLRKACASSNVVSRDIDVTQFGTPYDLSPCFVRASSVGLPTKRIRVFYCCLPAPESEDGIMFAHDVVAEG